MQVVGFLDIPSFVHFPWSAQPGWKVPSCKAEGDPKAPALLMLEDPTESRHTVPAGFLQVCTANGLHGMVSGYKFVSKKAAFELGCLSDSPKTWRATPVFVLSMMVSQAAFAATRVPAIASLCDTGVLVHTEAALQESKHASRVAESCAAGVSTQNCWLTVELGVGSRNLRHVWKGTIHLQSPSELQKMPQLKG
jgi:hypothetical protein